jgi:hypothetical protein
MRGQDQETLSEIRPRKAAIAFGRERMGTDSLPELPGKAGRDDDPPSILFFRFPAAAVL